MNSTRRIVWAEGTLLAQQHFQTWDCEQRSRERAYHLIANPHAWGICTIEYDEATLQNGRLTILKARVIFPDGSLIVYDSVDQAPLVCELDHSDHPVIDVYLCLPIADHVEGITGYPEKPLIAGWSAEYRQLADQYDEQRKREVLLAKPQLHLLTSRVNRSAFHSLKIAEACHEGQGVYHLSDRFIPPCVHLQASGALMKALSRIVEQLTSIERRERLDPILRYALSQLRYLQQATWEHPLTFYRCLIGICGVLDPDFSIPSYQQSQLTAIVLPLVDCLSRRLSDQKPAILHTFSLQLYDPPKRIIEDIDAQCFDTCTFFLGVKPTETVTHWVKSFIAQTKIGAPSMIDRIVNAALAGVTLTHCPSLPAQCEQRVDYDYFHLQATGAFWSHIESERAIALFSSPQFQEAAIECLAIENA